MHRIRRPRKWELYEGLPPPQPYAVESQFVEACGLRRSELLNLRVGDIRQDEEGRVWVHVAKSSGRSEREVPVLAGHEKEFLNHIRNVRVFSDFPRAFGAQYERGQYASMLYYQLLWEVQGPHPSGEYNQEVAQEVMKALGLSNLDFVCHYFLHLRDKPGDHRPAGPGLADRKR